MTAAYEKAIEPTFFVVISMALCLPIVALVLHYSALAIIESQLPIEDVAFFLHHNKGILTFGISVVLALLCACLFTGALRRQA